MYNNNNNNVVSNCRQSLRTTTMGSVMYGNRVYIYIYTVYNFKASPLPPAPLPAAGLLAGLLACCWLACWLAGLLACWPADWLAGWLACWLAGWLAGLLACWLAVGRGEGGSWHSLKWVVIYLSSWAVGLLQTDILAVKYRPQCCKISNMQH